MVFDPLDGLPPQVLVWRLFGEGLGATRLGSYGPVAIGQGDQFDPGVAGS
jgi:hypothetical protein